MVCVGLFGVTGAITIKNLIVDETCEFTYSGSAFNQNVSTLVAKATGPITVDNVWTRANLSGARWISAVCSRPSGGKYEVKNMTQSGNITGTSCVAGYFCFDGVGGLIENCRNVGDITRLGTADDQFVACAGFVARARANVTFKNCINNGTITAVGGCAAFLGTIAASNTFENCANYGPLVATAEGGKTGVAFVHQEKGTVTNDDGTTSEILKGTCTINGLEDFSGQKIQDPTLMYEVYTPDFTPEAGKELEPPSTPESSSTRVTTKKPDKTTAATTTADPNATTAPTVDDIVDDEEGCGSTVIGGLAVIMIVSGAALTLFKKKED